MTTFSREKARADILNNINNLDFLNSKDNYGITLLMLSARNNCTELVKLLIDAGVDINSQDNHNTTALKWATCFNQIDAVKMLIDAGANVNLNNCLYSVLFFNKPEIAKLLIDAGADVSFINKLDTSHPFDMKVQNKYNNLINKQ
jgi:ankyrin repeat protein